MRELEASLHQAGEFVLKAQLVNEHATPYCVRCVLRFLTRPASDEPLADQVRRFCEELEIEPSAATSTGRGATSRRCPSCRACRIRASSRNRIGIA